MARSGLGLALLLGTLCAPGCGGGSGGSSPQGPSTLPTPPPDSLAAGTVISVVSGEDGQPLAGVKATFAGREYTTSAAGQVTLAEAVRFGSLVDLVATGFLSRQTTLRSTGSTRFLLWPRTTANGVDETFTAQIVYTWAASEPPPEGTTTLERLREGTTQVVVRLSQELLQDDAAHKAHVAGVEAVNAWIGGRVRYSLSSTAPPVGLVIDTRVDPSAEDCKDARALFDGRYNARGEITGGEIVYCGQDVARTGTVTHELGHSVGLQHSFVRREEVMAPFFSRSRSSVFSPREGLVMNLLFERRAGNAYPDSDRSLSAAATSARARRIRCP
jgi:hypothetical protein